MEFIQQPCVCNLNQQFYTFVRVSQNSERSRVKDAEFPHERETSTNTHNAQLMQVTGKIVNFFLKVKKCENKLTLGEIHKRKISTKSSHTNSLKFFPVAVTSKLYVVT